MLRILNEIKEAFASARYLYFLSQNQSKSLDDISRMTLYFSSIGGYEVNGIYSGLCKTAYSRAFDILDKVARIINVYFHIGNRMTSFWEVFTSKQSQGEEHFLRFVSNPSIHKFTNPALYALADLCIDYFESEHVDFKLIDARRNRITHDYLTAKLYMTSEENENNNLIELKALHDQTKNVLLLAKYAVLYTGSAINLAEKNKESFGKTLKITIGINPGQPYL